MNLLIITQKVDEDDQLLGFFIGWIREFAGRFEKVSVLCLEKGKFDLPENVRVFSLGKDTGASKLHQLFNFYKYCFGLRKDYDAVFVHMNPIWVIMGWKTWFVLRKKVFLWYAHKKVTPKLRLATKLSSGIFTSTSEGFRLASAKVAVVGQGIDTDVFKPNLSKRKDGISILSVGRLTKSKNYEVLIDATKILKDEGLDFEVTIIGEPGLISDRVYEHKIRTEINEHGLKDNFKFLGKIAHRNLPSYYQSHRLFINTGTTGSLDKTIVEAMACGCIVISSNDAARKFLPEDLVINNDPVELAKKIKYAATQDFRQELVDHVVNNHSLAGLIDKIYNKIS